MGIHSNIEELYCRANMVIIQITLNSRNVKAVMGTIKILADFSNTILEIAKAASKFWELEADSY